MAHPELGVQRPSRSSFLQALSMRRREMLATALGVALAGCRIGPGPTPSPNDSRLPIGDAHVHLFNGADLPVAGFFELVLIPAYLSTWPDVGLALVDIAKLMKKFCKTAAEEYEDIKAAMPPGAEMSPKDFAQEVIVQADRAIQARRVTSQFQPQVDLGDSYVALARLIALENARYGGASVQSIITISRAQLALSRDAATIDKDALTRIAEHGAEVLDQGTPVTSALLGFSFKEIWALIGWAFRMIHSRTAHVREYLDAMRSDFTRPTLAVNLLVDYDCWLADGPEKGSEQADQVRFWTRFARARSAPIQIETFVGFDPLKHAVEKLKPSPAYFQQLTGWAQAAPQAERRVTGFKLYPPMGFSVWGNKPLPDPNPGRAAKIARDLWRASGGTDDNFAAKIDEALGDIFNFATANDIPLLAHGRNSNEAYPKAGEKARPKYWRERAENMPPRPGRHPLRACLGHYRAEFNQSGDVVKILNLNCDGLANIYFDVAFDEEILQPKDADALLKGIEDICAATKDKDRSAGYFMFGTDWIMLAQIPHHKRYVDAFDAAIGRSKIFWLPKREQLMGGNLRRFLKLGGSAPG